MAHHRSGLLPSPLAPATSTPSLVSDALLPPAVTPPSLVLAVASSMTEGANPRGMRSVHRGDCGSSHIARSPGTWCRPTTASNVTRPRCPGSGTGGDEASILLLLLVLLVVLLVVVLLVPAPIGLAAPAAGRDATGGDRPALRAAAVQASLIIRAM